MYGGERIAYNEEYAFAAGDSSELVDWLQNNMNWYECSTLEALPYEPAPLHKAEVAGVEVME